MTDNEVTYFACGHRTVWGQISKHAKFRNKKGEMIYCGRCSTWRKVAKTIREAA